MRAAGALLLAATLSRCHPVERKQMSDEMRRGIMAAAPRVTLRAAGVAIELQRIPPGEFTMGSPPDEPGRAPNEPMRRVRISRPFYLGRFEVTQAQYRTVMGR